MTNEFSFELKPSTIHGVGVFAREEIAEGDPLALWGDEVEPRKITPVLDVELAERYGFCGYCPQMFNRMAIGWYLNHSDNPNAGNVDDVFYATRDIGKGEELTVDYRTLEGAAQKC